VENGRPSVKPLTTAAFRPLLLVLTATSGLVDAASYLQFGHVFVANMTGNIVFIGFAIAGASGLSPISSLIAIVGFAIGAIVAGRIAPALGGSGIRLLRGATLIEFLIILVASLVALSLPVRANDWERDLVVVLLAGAMGLQSAMTTRLKIPGFNSTVVLTTMLSTLAAESQLAGGKGAENGWRISAVLSMLLGALVGAELLFHMAVLAPLLLAAAAVAAVSASAFMLSRRP
jgi:uncharacterized membrane protein YoaK (UPF0700 family)